MRMIRPALWAALTVSLVVFAGILPASAANPSSLPWHSPNQVSSGVPVAVSSIAACPPVPTPGDSTLIEISLTFQGGGASTQVLPANPDGSWAGDVTFTFSGVPRQATTHADCVDFNGNGGVTYAQYQTHHTHLSTT
jgi:hypothetical protein